MINHYRTLLLNITDQNDPSEYIAPTFTTLNLPTELSNFYNLLFPKNPSRFYAQFIAYCYLQLLKAANQQQFVTSLDSRLTYELLEISDYFLINQISTPIISNFQFPISIFGSYNVNSTTSENYEDFYISQISTIYVSVYSKTNNLYYNSNSTSPVLTPDYNIKLVDTLTQTTSNTINISTTGLSFVISGNFITFSSTSNLNWEFIAQAPFIFDFNQLFNLLLGNTATINSMLNYKSELNDNNSSNLWKLHYNPVYRFAGLLNNYILKVNSLLN